MKTYSVYLGDIKPQGLVFSNDVIATFDDDKMLRAFMREVSRSMHCILMADNGDDTIIFVHGQPQIVKQDIHGFLCVE